MANELRLLRQQRDELDDAMQRYEWALAHGIGPQPGTEVCGVTVVYGVYGVTVVYGV